MLTLPPSVHIYMATDVVDLRRGHDGLAIGVRRQGHGMDKHDGREIGATADA